MRAFAIVILAVVVAGSALADEKPVELKNAPGRDKVEAHCGACHSLDYIVMNSPFPNTATWDAEVAKMINAFGAPIDQTDAKIISEYLKANYGEDRHVRAKQPAADRQGPGSQRMAKSAHANRKNVVQKSSVARKAASGRGAAPVSRRHARLARPSSRPGLLNWLKTRLAASAFRSNAGKYANPYECWQDEGYGRRTPCGGGAAGGGGDGGGGGGGDGGGGMGN